ncbi:MAG: DJ-1/PfpI family protein [Treponema sp.]|jgi:4-methyl-5(b-hydroxyethyl)-thiazole monophosphate biosynthesis|nr:DJ-1/PfpI family protein [Treponema sp.]
MTKKALVLLAEGFEEVEAITPVDYLRRAGIEVTIAAVGLNIMVKGARGISILADTSLSEPRSNSWDAVVIPGGMPGAANIAASKEAGVFIKEMAAGGKMVCAICASPAVVLTPLGLLAGKQFTCYPGMEAKVNNGIWLHEQVVRDGNIITSRGAGTAGTFAIAIISAMLDEAAGKKIAEAVLL